MSDTPESDYASFEEQLTSIDVVTTGFARKLERERNEWKSKFIQQNKDLGCELHDPNRAIWSHAATLEAEIKTLKADLETARKSLMRCSKSHCEMSARMRRKIEADDLSKEL